MGERSNDSGFDPEFLDRYQNLPPEVLALARTVSNNELKQVQIRHLTLRIVAIGAYLLAGLIIWWAWAVRETLQSTLAIAIVVYVFAGGLFQALWDVIRRKFRQPAD